jgi:hypothetical protein
MTSERHSRLQALLTEAEAAHGEYETTELQGVYDQDWPRWYARYAVDHGIGDIVGHAVTADALATILARSWDEFQQTDRADPWASYTARRIAAAW